MIHKNKQMLFLLSLLPMAASSISSFWPRWPLTSSRREKICPVCELRPTAVTTIFPLPSKTWVPARWWKKSWREIRILKGFKDWFHNWRFHHYTINPNAKPEPDPAASYWPLGLTPILTLTLTLTPDPDLNTLYWCMFG